MFEIDDLNTFVEIADAGGISAAAKRIGVSKSIVSRRLARLEADLGARLLARTTRGAALTEAGVTFRDHAASICAEMNLARDALHPSGDLRGLLRIACPLSFGATHLAPVLAEFARRHPSLQLHACYSDTFVDLVAEGFDAGIRVGYLADSSLMASKIASVRGKVVASPAYVAKHGAPATLDDLASHEAVMQGTEPWRFDVGSKRVIVHPRGRFKSDNGVAIAVAAIAGLGLAALPDFLIDEHIASGALVTVLNDYKLPEAGIYVVRPPGGRPSRKIQALTEILREHFAPEEP